MSFIAKPGCKSKKNVKKKPENYTRENIVRKWGKYTYVVEEFHAFYRMLYYLSNKVDGILPLAKNIGTSLDNIRETMGYKRCGLAEEVGIANQTLTGFRDGIRYMKPEKLVSILEHLKVPFPAVFAGLYHIEDKHCSPRWEIFEECGVPYIEEIHLYHNKGVVISYEDIEMFFEEITKQQSQEISYVCRLIAQYLGHKRRDGLGKYAYYLSDDKMMARDIFTSLAIVFGVSPAILLLPFGEILNNDGEYLFRFEDSSEPMLTNEDSGNHENDQVKQKEQVMVPEDSSRDSNLFERDFPMFEVLKKAYESAKTEKEKDFTIKSLINYLDEFSNINK